MSDEPLPPLDELGTGAWPLYTLPLAPAPTERSTVDLPPLESTVVLPPPLLYTARWAPRAPLGGPFMAH